MKVQLGKKKMNLPKIRWKIQYFFNILPFMTRASIREYVENEYESSTKQKVFFVFQKIRWRI